jgi:hypothetical protein
VRDKLRYAGPDRGAAVRGFSSGDITRGDVEDWLTAKSARRRASRAALAVALLK